MNDRKLAVDICETLFFMYKTGALDDDGTAWKLLRARPTIQDALTVMTLTELLCPDPNTKLLVTISKIEPLVKKHNITWEDLKVT